MRDIVPSPDSSLPEKEIQSPPQLLPPKGTPVPVSKIHLMGDRDVPWQKSNQVPKQLVQRNPRPLFFKGEAPKAKVGHKERSVLFAFFGLAIIIAIVAAIIFLPSAKVHIVLRTSPLIIDKDIVIKAEENANATSVPGTIFFRELEQTGRTTVISTETVGTKAKGTAQIVNKTIEEQKIKEGSRLVTKDNVLFYMRQSAIIPPNSSVTVDIEAAEAGTSGNIQPQNLTFAALPASAQSIIYGQTTEAITSGTGEVVPVVTAVDLEKAEEEALVAARAKIEDEIRKQLPMGWIILEESWTAELQSFTPQAAIGDRVADFGHTAHIKVSVIGYEKDTFARILEQNVSEELSQDYMLFPGEITYSKSLGAIDWEGGKAVVSTHVEHMTIPKLSLDALKDKLSGRSLEEAEQYLKGLPSVSTANIDLSPFWVQNVPKITDRITIELESDRK